MKIVICDDEKNFIDKLSMKIETVISDLDLNVIVLKYESGKELLDAYNDIPDIDIIFMDILLKNENGYEVASQIRRIDHKVKIIFLTSIVKYALKGYEIGATRYLVKPVETNKLRSVLKTTINEVLDASEQFIVEKNDEGVYKIFFDDIIYIETYGRNTVIHTEEKNIVSYKAMKTHLKNLNDNFVRCHAAYIINLGYIVELGKTDIRLKNQIVVPLSKNRRKEVKEKIVNYYSSYLED